MKICWYSFWRGADPCSGGSEEKLSKEPVLKDTEVWISPLSGSTAPTNRGASDHFVSEHLFQYHRESSFSRVFRYILPVLNALVNTDLISKSNPKKSVTKFPKALNLETAGKRLNNSEVFCNAVSFILAQGLVCACSCRVKDKRLSHLPKVWDSSLYVLFSKKHSEELCSRFQLQCTEGYFLLGATRSRGDAAYSGLPSTGICSAHYLHNLFLRVSS